MTTLTTINPTNELKWNSGEEKLTLTGLFLQRRRRFKTSRRERNSSKSRERQELKRREDMNYDGDFDPIFSSAKTPRSLGWVFFISAWKAFVDVLKGSPRLFMKEARAGLSYFISPPIFGLGLPTVIGPKLTLNFFLFFDKRTVNFRFNTFF